MRCYVAEFVGTFAVVLFGCGAIAVVPDGPAKALSVNVVFGLTVACMIYALRSISKAHFNPAVTLGFVVSRQFPLLCAVPYWVAQFLGAIVAAGMVSLLSLTGNIGATLPTVSVYAAVGIEALLTFFLMLVIRGSASGFAGAAIGGVVLVCGLFAGGLTGNALNPARSLGPAIFQPGSLPSLWVYIVGPCLGAVAASTLYSWLSPALKIEPVASCC